MDLGQTQTSYMRLASEVEARNVEARFRLNSDARKQLEPACSSADVAAEDLLLVQIILDGLLPSDAL